jgi:hypothetical protein
MSKNSTTPILTSKRSGNSKDDSFLALKLIMDLELDWADIASYIDYMSQRRSLIKEKIEGGAYRVHAFKSSLGS